MTGTGDRLRILRRAARDWATQLSHIAVEAEHDPEVVRRHSGITPLRYLANANLPAGLATPVVVRGQLYRGDSCRELAVVLEELGAGDAGLVFGAPGAALSGSLIADLADEAQRDAYHRRLADRPTWTLTALTEPRHGSDANGLEATLARDGDGFLLNGVKRYIGNGARADVGVLFARRGAGPLSLTAVLIDTTAPGLTATPLPTIGLRAAGLGHLVLKDVRVAPEQLLGRHLPATRRGLWAALRLFNRARPLVAAVAVGVARAAYRYVLANQAQLSTAERATLDRLARRLIGTSQLVHRAAAAVDADPNSGYLGSTAKVRAVSLVEEVTATALTFLGPAARLEHPVLDKLARDARGFEFMEGTTNIQKLNLFAGLHRGHLDHG